MDRQIFIDRLLESENLTDNLEDEAADHLLKWGVSQLDGVLNGIQEEAAADERVHALMLAMRDINRIVGSLPHAAPEKIAELAVHYAQAHGKDADANPAKYNAVAAEVSELRGLEAVTFLLNWLQKK